MSEGAIGDLAVINPLMYVLLALPTGRWLDRRFGRALSAGALLTAGGALLRLAGPASYAWILAGQVVLSAGQPLVLNATTKVAARYFPASQRTAAISVASAAQFCGILAAALTGGPLQQAGGLRLLLLVQAVVAVTGAACVLVAVRVPATFAADSPVAISLRWLRRDRVMWLLAGLLFIGVGVFNAVATWLDAILGHFGHGGASGTLIAIMTVAGIAGAAVLPGAVARRDRRRTMLLVTTAVTAVVFLAIAAVPGVLFAGCALAVEGFVLLRWPAGVAGLVGTARRAGTGGHRRRVPAAGREPGRDAVRRDHPGGHRQPLCRAGRHLGPGPAGAGPGRPPAGPRRAGAARRPGPARPPATPRYRARVTGPDGPGPGGGSAADGPLGRKVPGPARRRLAWAAWTGAHCWPAGRRVGPVPGHAAPVRRHVAVPGRFAVAWAASVALPASRQSALLWWASTDVANLRHDPEGSLVASAFLPDGGFLTWVPLIALAMFGANRALGNARTALVVVAGQVVGTLVSEGIVAYRIGHGLLPAADDRIMDVGPSYVVVSAIVAAVLFGAWPARIAAAFRFDPPRGGRGHLRRAEHAAGRRGRPRHRDRRVPAARPAADPRPGAGRPRARPGQRTGRGIDLARCPAR